MEATTIYNGLTIEQIINNLPADMIQSHREEYINNIKEIIKIESIGRNAESLRFRNFIMINTYYTPQINVKMGKPGNPANIAFNALDLEHAIRIGRQKYESMGLMGRWYIITSTGEQAQING